MEGVPAIALKHLLEAVQPMGEMVMSHRADHMRNVDNEGNIVLPIVRYTEHNHPYRDYVVLLQNTFCFEHIEQWCFV
jgi:hypothetical protein